MMSSLNLQSLDVLVEGKILKVVPLHIEELRTAMNVPVVLDLEELHRTILNCFCSLVLVLLNVIVHPRMKGVIPNLNILYFY